MCKTAGGCNQLHYFVITRASLVGDAHHAAGSSLETRHFPMNTNWLQRFPEDFWMYLIQLFNNLKCIID